MDPLGSLIREARENKGWTQSRLAMESGVEYTQISRIEAGKIPGTSFDNIRRLARALGVSLDEIDRRLPEPIPA